jgi:hypothetical protein
MYTGPYSVSITPAMIEDIIVDTSGRTTYTVETDLNGAAKITATMLTNSANGCQSNSSIFVQLKDIFPWTRVYSRFFTTGTAACWGWNGNNGYGEGRTSSERQGHLLAYNASLKDFTKNEFNVWNSPQYRKYFSACDNNADNYMRFNSTGRSFDISSRRNNMEVLAGPSHGRTCSGTGTVIISNIRIV